MKTRRAGRGDRIVGVPLGLFVVMSLGLVLLMLGVVWLFVVAEHERKEALAQIPEQRRAAEWMFARELADALEDVVDTHDVAPRDLRRAREHVLDVGA